MADKGFCQSFRMNIYPMFIFLKKVWLPSLFHNNPGPGKVLHLGECLVPVPLSLALHESGGKIGVRHTSRRTRDRWIRVSVFVSVLNMIPDPPLRFFQKSAQNCHKSDVKCAPKKSVRSRQTDFFLISIRTEERESFNLYRYA